MGCLCLSNATSDRVKSRERAFVKVRAVEMLGFAILVVLMVAGVGFMLFVLFNLVRDSHKKGSETSYFQIARQFLKSLRGSESD